MFRRRAQPSFRFRENDYDMIIMKAINARLIYGKLKLLHSMRLFPRVTVEIIFPGCRVIWFFRNLQAAPVCFRIQHIQGDVLTR